MKRYRKITLVRVDPEVEGFRTLNRRTQRNRDRQDAIRKECYAAAQWQRCRLRELKRRHRAQMAKLIRRISLNSLLCLGVFVCWLVHWVRLPCLLVALLICSCIVSFTLGDCRPKKGSGGIH